MILWALSRPSRPVSEERTDHGLKVKIAHALAHLVPLRRLLGGGVELTRLELQIPGLPEELDGLTLAHVSDLHVGDGMWLPVDAPEAAELVRAAHPDVVINTGDYLQGKPRVERVRHVARAFLLHRGVSRSQVNLAVLGNHDYYAGKDRVAELTRELEGLGVSVLVNRAICVPFRGGGISFVGLTADAPGFDEAVDSLLEAGHPRIALLHEPDLAEHLPPGAADLALAGHTHGGQITLPGLTSIITRKIAHSRYVGGLYRINEIPVYVNRGLGCSGFPIRFGARAEVTVIRLVH